MGKKKLWLIAGLSVLADQALKYFLDGTERILIPGVLALRATKNTGFALGLVPGGGIAALVLSALITGVLLLVLHKVRVRGPALIAMGLLLGGAIGNLIDRSVLGYVRDSFELLFVNFYIFNFADVCVTGGAALAAVSLLFFEKDWEKK